MKKLAPILVQVYTRKKHFIKCIESLSSCRLADQSHLFIVSDAASSEKDKLSVNEIRNYCKTIKGFAKVELIALDKNVGTVKAFEKAREIIYSQYDAMIYTEDDNVFSQLFLEYINDGLFFYRNNPRIFSICGYSPPLKSPSKYYNDILVYVAYCAWGSGHWKDKDLIVDDYIRSFFIDMRRKEDIKKYIKKMSFPLFFNAKRIYKDKVNLGDVAKSYHCYMNNMLNIYPVQSLVRNMGFDGTGVNMGRYLGYSTQSIQEKKEKIIFEENPIESPAIDRQFCKYSISPFKGKWSIITIGLKYKTYMYFYYYPQLYKTIFWLCKKTRVKIPSTLKLLMTEV